MEDKQSSYGPYNLRRFVHALLKSAQQQHFKHGGLFVCLADGTCFEAHDFKAEGGIFQFIFNNPDGVSTLMCTPFDQIVSLSVSEDTTPSHLPASMRNAKP